MHRTRFVMKMSARAVLGTLRLALFTALLLASRMVVPLFRLAVTAGIVLFGFCALARRDQTTPMWAGAVLALAGVALELALGAAVRALAPSDVVVISEV
ncbi:hypothetical protein NX784_28015 [Massilia pinisoli]|uniref:DUF4173 domain-containing protein n=1 Tax=Massilia pinisoli TaxID=1772194 RepID=A0ABT1ZZS6_9BURK|nr:hypothetical protein [Massilia pinisoli]MCS0585433.1 hypothetical protein [Massilia pinisoli]